MQLVDILQSSSPVFDPSFSDALASLQKQPGPFADAHYTLLSGLTMQQHDWFTKNAGAPCLSRNWCSRADCCLHASRLVAWFSKDRAMDGINQQE